MEKQKLGNPLFVITILILVLNDWYFKQTFHNSLTGKLSDFAGLFVFPFLLSALFPRKAKLVYSFTFFFFIAWKSPLIQPVINALQGIGIQFITRLIMPTILHLLVCLFHFAYLINRLRTTSGLQF